MSAGAKVAIIVGVGGGAGAGAYLATQSGRSQIAEGPSTDAIFGRLFDASGASVGDEFGVSGNPSASESDPAVASDPAGNFVVAWTSDSGDGSYLGIRARRFDNSGNPLGSDFQVNTYTTGSQIESDVGMNENGFVVVWSSDPGEDGSARGVFSQRFDSSGNPLGGEFQVNTATTGNQDAPSVAMNASGFVVVWQGAIQDGSGNGIFGQRYDASGNPLGGELQVNLYTTGDQDQPDVALDPAGSFLVVWSSAGQDGSSTAAVGRRFDANGDPIAAEFLVNAATAGAQSRPQVAIDPSGQFVVTWESFGHDDPSTPDEAGVFAQRFSASGRRLEAEFLVNAHTTGNQRAPAVAIDGRGQFFIVWESYGQDGPGSGYSVFARRAGFPEGAPIAVDTRTSNGASDVNGVLETGERVTVDPAWKNRGPTALSLTGGAPSFTGLPGPAYTIHDGTTDYGSIAVGDTNRCFETTGDCLEVELVGARPATHWDAALDEALSEGVTKTWLLHIGGSFGDVPTTNLFYAFIENLLHNGVTAGGACGGYCPTDGVKRQQMAVFLLKSRFGPTFTPPPATGAIFADVPITNPFAAWIEALYLLGITGGCVVPPPPALPSFCPDAIVNRQQMAVFLLKTLEGSAYTPPACTIPVFQDVPCGSPFAAWIEELYARQVTGGCVANPLQYCPTNPTNRQQMAAFLVKTFGLLLYGP